MNLPTHEAQTRPLRLIHFSDIHLTSSPLGWRKGDWFNRRFPGWFNLRALGRGKRFSEAPAVLSALMAAMRQNPPDHVIFSGDATALGFESELAHAAEIMGLRNGKPLEGLAIPGNHDYYTPMAAKSGLFERYFAPWQQGIRVDEATYPFVQRVGPVWLIALNSSVPNRWFWDASGYVDQAQLDRLDLLLQGLAEGPRILVTHYPVCLANGRPETPIHGLRNLAETIDVAARGGICLWLHGHRHGAYQHQQTVHAPFPIVCAGSATQRGKWSYGEYTLSGRTLQVNRRHYDPVTGSFREGETFALNL